MTDCFKGCSELTKGPKIRMEDKVDLTRCFAGCTKLDTLPILDGSSAGYDVKANMNSCFKDCTALTNIPAEMLDENGAIKMWPVSDMTSCFEGCTGLSGKTFYFRSGPTVASKWTDAFKGLTGVILKVPNADVKTAVQSASGNSGVTVYCPADPEYND